MSMNSSCLFCGDPEPKEWVGQGHNDLLTESLSEFCTAFDLNDPGIYIDLLTSSTLCGSCIQGILDLGCLMRMIQRLEERMVKVKTELRLKIEEQWLLKRSSGYQPPLVTSLYRGILGRLGSTVTDIDMDGGVAVKDELLSDTEIYQEYQGAFLREEDDEPRTVSSRRLLRPRSSFKGRKGKSPELDPDYILPDNPSESNLQSSFKCPVEPCGKTFRTEKKLTDHSRYHRRKQGKEMIYTNKIDLDSDKILALDPVARGIEKARLSSPKSVEPRAPTERDSTHRPRRRYILPKVSCDLCDYVTNIKRDLKIHISSVHPGHTESHQCPSCNTTYIVKGYLEQHMKKCHSNEPKFKCPICHQSQGLQSSDALQEHEKFHKESPNPFTCSTCSQVFSTTMDLRRHVFEHEHPSETFETEGGCTEQTKTKQFVCDQCGKSFHLASNLKQHQAVTHSSARTFLCDLCPMTYKEKGKLQRHKNSAHFNIRRFQCTLCPKAFVSNNALKMHEEIHSGLKNYPCELCRKKFSTKKNWRRHSKSSMHRDNLRNGRCQEDVHGPAPASSGISSSFVNTNEKQETMELQN